MGPGAVFDLIRDHNGNVSNSLKHYLADRDYVAKNKQHILLALAHLKLYLLENNIISMPIKPKNILYQLKSDGTGTLHIVDNIGNADFIPIASYFYYFGNRKIIRRWDSFFTVSIYRLLFNFRFNLLSLRAKIPLIILLSFVVSFFICLYCK